MAHLKYRRTESSRDHHNVTVRGSEVEVDDAYNEIALTHTKNSTKKALRQPYASGEIAQHSGRSNTDRTNSIRVQQPDETSNEHEGILAPLRVAGSNHGRTAPPERESLLRNIARMLVGMEVPNLDRSAASVRSGETHSNRQPVSKIQPSVEKTSPTVNRTQQNSIPHSELPVSMLPSPEESRMGLKRQSMDILSRLHHVVTEAFEQARHDSQLTTILTSLLVRNSAAVEEEKQATTHPSSSKASSTSEQHRSEFDCRPFQGPKTPPSPNSKYKEGEFGNNREKPFHGSEIKSQPSILSKNCVVEKPPPVTMERQKRIEVQSHDPVHDRIHSRENYVRNAWHNHPPDDDDANSTEMNHSSSHKQNRNDICCCHHTNKGDSSTRNSSSGDHHCRRRNSQDHGYPGHSESMRFGAVIDLERPVYDDIQVIDKPYRTDRTGYDRRMSIRPLRNAIYPDTGSIYRPDRTGQSNSRSPDIHPKTLRRSHGQQERFERERELYELKRQRLDHTGRTSSSNRGRSSDQQESRGSMRNSFFTDRSYQHHSRPSERSQPRPQPQSHPSRSLTRKPIRQAYYHAPPSPRTVACSFSVNTEYNPPDYGPDETPRSPDQVTPKHPIVAKNIQQNLTTESSLLQLSSETIRLQTKLLQSGLDLSLYNTDELRRLRNWICLQPRIAADREANCLRDDVAEVSTTQVKSPSKSSNKHQTTNYSIPPEGDGNNPQGAKSKSSTASSAESSTSSTSTADGSSSRSSSSDSSRSSSCSDSSSSSGEESSSHETSPPKLTRRVEHAEVKEIIPANELNDHQEQQHQVTLKKVPTPNLPCPRTRYHRTPSNPMTSKYVADKGKQETPSRSTISEKSHQQWSPIQCIETHDPDAIEFDVVAFNETDDADQFEDFFVSSPPDETSQPVWHDRTELKIAVESNPLDKMETIVSTNSPCMVNETETDKNVEIIRESQSIQLTNISSTRDADLDTIPNSSRGESINQIEVVQANTDTCPVRRTSSKVADTASWHSRRRISSVRLTKALRRVTNQQSERGVNCQSPSIQSGLTHQSAAEEEEGEIVSDCTSEVEEIPRQRVSTKSPPSSDSRTVHLPLKSIATAVDTGAICRSSVCSDEETEKSSRSRWVKLSGADHRTNIDSDRQSTVRTERKRSRSVTDRRNTEHRYLRRPRYDPVEEAVAVMHEHELDRTTQFRVRRLTSRQTLTPYRVTKDKRNVPLRSGRTKQRWVSPRFRSDVHDKVTSNRRYASSQTYGTRSRAGRCFNNRYAGLTKSHYRNHRSTTKYFRPYSGQWTTTGSDARSYAHAARYSNVQSVQMLHAPQRRPFDLREQKLSRTNS